ncbi:MAG: nitrate- and nitrite sensing domain-containing protein [Pantoea sp.]|uniref:nitrate regulatory protein n=1 Tax=unclassified Pantoea TaxID=2630326 RepID=UPI0003AC8118|nr:nitrate regulatory protein [Pantoea sp. AS-PWVM4]ERK17955.1 Response regulator NasT [Pantoea sp. AS-PWVM4]
MTQAVDYLHASRASEIASLQRLLRTGELITAISELIHRLQRERGVSNIWLCSTGRVFGDELEARAQDVQSGQRHMLSVLPAADAQPGYSRFCLLIAAALQALEGLPALRAQVRSLQLSHAQAMDAFNHIIRTLLNLVFEAADTASEPDISRALIALFSFMQGKELAGQERATGSAGFAAGQFTPEQRQRVQALIEAQEQSFATFSQFADAQNLQRWRRMSDAGSEVERLRRIACTGAHCGDNGVLQWFSLLTARLDNMKQVEDGLSAALMSCCRRAMAETQQHDANATLLADEAGFTLYVAGANWLAGQDVTLDSNGLAPQLGRSVLSLIREQAQRLQAQADELASMRASLDERKVIDQAKGWLMQQHGYSEQDAWQTLRKSAMNQNKRILEIAQAILAVAATLKV